MLKSIFIFLPTPLSGYQCVTGPVAENTQGEFFFREYLRGTQGLTEKNWFRWLSQLSDDSPSNNNKLKDCTKPDVSLSNTAVT